MPANSSRSVLTRTRRVAVVVATAALVASALVDGTSANAAPPVPAAASKAKVTQRPDRVTASRAAVAQGSQVEVMGERSEIATTWANADGSFTTENYAGPVRVAQTDGSWADVDLTLVVANGQVVPKVAPVPFVLSNGGTAALATETLASGVAQVDWAGTLPTPVLSGTTATYAEVLPGVDLVVEALRTGFEVKYVLKSAPTAALALPLSLSLTGLTATRRSDGGLTITDEKGSTVGDSGQPVVFDASLVPGTDYPARQSVATTALSKPVPAIMDAVSAETKGGNVSVPTGAAATKSTWTLTPDVAWLADPATVYPVTVDPTLVLSTTLDTYIDQTNPSTSYSSATRMYIGTPTGSGNVKRAYIAFAKPTALTGMYISDAYLQLYNSASSTCAASQAPVYVYGLPANFSSGVTWTTRATSVWPGAVPAGSANFTHGGPNGACDSGAYDNIHIVPLAQSWADGTNSVYAVQVSSTETDLHGYKTFYAADAGSGVPTLRTTYWAYPTLSGSPTIPGATSSGGVFAVNSLTPVFKQTVNHASGLVVAAEFKIKTAAGVLVWTGNGNTVAAGQTSQIQVPSGLLTDGATYTLQTRGLHSTQYSKASSAVVTFQIHATVPPAPTVTSSTYTASSWASSLTAGSFTFSTTQSDVNRYTYQFDSGPWTTVAANSLGGSATPSITPPAGWHTLKVKAVNTSGMESATATSYTFGAPGMSSPSDGDKTLRYITLNAAAASNETGVKFQYQLPGTTGWTDIPLADVKQAGATISAWPPTVVAGSQATAASQLVWDAKTTLGADTPVTIQAVFSGASAITTVNNPISTLDSKAYGLMYASADVGVGTASLQTGNLAISGSDAAVASFGGGLSVSRTFNSLDPTAAPATGSPVFGPGWVSGLTSDQSDWVKVEDQGTQVALTDTDGGLWYFAKGSTNAGTTDYPPLADAALAGYTLTATGTAPNKAFTLTDVDGGSTTITAVNSSWSGTPSRSTPEPYQVTATRQAGINGTATFEYNADGTPKALYAPTATGVTCTTSTINAGCRLLVFTYTDADPGAGVATRLSKVTLKTTDPTGASTVAVDVACYTYDAAASYRLSKVWDPRVAGSSGWSTTCGTPVQATTYTYNTDGRIASITADGLTTSYVIYGDGTNTPLGWFEYTKRTHTATYGSAELRNTVRYNVSIAATTSTDDTHPDLSPIAIATWGQTTAPLSAAVVYGPGDTVSSTDLKDGIVYALDADGKTTNTAVYSGTGQAGWRIDSTDYADNGNVTRTLTAANRDRALNPGNYPDLADLGLATATSPVIADALSTRSFYSADGVDVTDVYGPAHTVVLPDGTQAPARAHDHTDYGTTNYPTVNPASWTSGAPLHTATKTTESATLTLNAVPLNETDTTETRYAYGLSSTDHLGWDLRQPLSTTVENGATDITTVTRYDSDGNVIEQRQPSATSASNPGTRLTTYYSAGSLSTTNCTSTVWYGQLCRTAPGAQPTTSGLPGLVSTTYQYDAALRPTTTIETVTPAGGGNSTRTTTTTYRNSGASTQVDTLAVTSDVGTAVPTTTLGYAATTGLPTTRTNGTTTQTLAYDDFGQPVTYTDGDGANTKLTRDSRDRLASTTWTKTDGTTTLGSATYTYIDPATAGDHRGALKSITDSTLGVISATYDPLGNLLSQTLATGLSQAFTTDPTGDTTSTTWTDSGNNVFLGDVQSSDIHGRWRLETLTGADPGWNSRTYTYDGAGRLTTVGDLTDNLDCQTRTYTFDINSNRTAAAIYPAATDGSCTTSTTATSSQSLSYDNADRMLATTGTAGAGTVYDAWGRITTLPAALSSTSAAGDATTTYYTNDLVRSLSQNGATRTWTLDPAGRLATMTTSGLGSTALTNHYSDTSSDSPAWTTDTDTAGSTTTRRYIPGIAGLLAEADTTGATTTSTIQLTGLHGDVLRTTSPSATLSPDGPGTYIDEYGRALDPNTTDISTGPRYGWLGGKQRPTDTGTSGLSLMGVRLYAPVTGRFLSTDPIYGGNMNAYSYPADPINAFDLDGRMRTVLDTYPEPFWLDAKRLSGPARIEGVYFDRYGRQIPLRTGIWRWNRRKGHYSGWGLAKIQAHHDWNPWVENMIQLTLVIGRIKSVHGNVETWQLSLPCNIPGGFLAFRVVIDTRTREADGLRRGIINAYEVTKP